jgi:hypothetical protein
MAMLDLGSTCKWVQVPLFLASPFLRLRVWGPDFLFFLVGTDFRLPANAASFAGIFLGRPRPLFAGLLHEEANGGSAVDLELVVQWT